MSNINQLNRWDIVYIKPDTTTRYLIDCMYVNSWEYGIQWKDWFFNRKDLLTERKIKKNKN